MGLDWKEEDVPFWLPDSEVVGSFSTPRFIFGTDHLVTTARCFRCSFSAIVDKPTALQFVICWTNDTWTFFFRYGPGASGWPYSRCIDRAWKIWWSVSWGSVSSTFAIGSSDLLKMAILGLFNFWGVTHPKNPELGWISHWIKIHSWNQPGLHDYMITWLHDYMTTWLHVTGWSWRLLLCQVPGGWFVSNALWIFTPLVGEIQYHKCFRFFEVVETE